MIKSFIIPCICLLLLAACHGDEPTLPDGSLPLVVEGWIEDGQPPIVIVTHAADLSQDIDDLEQFVEKWCRVTVDDGVNSVILTGRVDHNYTPAFVYTTTRMRGQLGHTYRLTIETESQTATAEATILPSARIDSLHVLPTAQSDTLYAVYAYASGIADDQKYKFFTQLMHRESRFYSSFLGTFSGTEYDPETGFDVRRGIHDTGGGTFTPYYSLGDTVRVKLCTLQDEVYTFWHDYENAVSMSSNMFFNATTACRGNVSGAKGYWAAYGTAAATIIVR